MKKNNIFNAVAAIAAIAMIAASCGEEPVASVDSTGSSASDLIYATAENSTTKTALSGNDTDGYEVVWSANDEITVGGYGGCDYILHSGVGSSSAVFYKKNSSVTLSDGQYDSYYRMYSNSLPATQKYEEGSIKGAPMHATVTVKGGVPEPAHFKNLCGLLRLTIKKRQDISLKSISISADQAMCGSFNIVNDAAVVTSSSKQVTLKCDTAVPLSYGGTDFYIALPPNDYSNVVITLTDENGTVCTKKLNSAKTLNIERSKITSAKFYVERLDFIPSNLVAVDLGLPSGTKWANMNMGADMADDNGDYFAWGETSFKNQYDWNTYSDYNTSSGGNTFLKYYNEDGGKTVLDPEDDIAHARWGGNWQVPSPEQWSELLDPANTTWTWVGVVYAYDSTGERCDYGYMVESNSNQNKIFLTLNGCYINAELYATDVGYYWSNTISSTDNKLAQVLFLQRYKYNNDYVDTHEIRSNVDRLRGVSVRPVCK